MAEQKTELKLGVWAGRHERIWTPLTASLNASAVEAVGQLPTESYNSGLECPILAAVVNDLKLGTLVGGWSLAELDESDKLKRSIPCQLEVLGEEVLVHFLVERLLPNTRQRYLLRHEEVKAPLVELRETGEEKVEVLIGDSLFTSYQYSGRYVRPFLHPVIGPFGDPVTRELEGDPNQGFDHKHHRSIYSAWGDVNGADIWSEEAGHGLVVHHCFARHFCGSVFGQLIAHNVWTDKNRKPLMDEVTLLRFYALPRGARLFDYTITFYATQSDVRFGDTKEGGILSVRVYPSMDVRAAGQMENSWGGMNEREIWGRRAEWCDYSGPVRGNWVGLAVFDHPLNFRYPTYWHARDYGLMTANPFGLSAFLGAGHDGSHVLRRRERLTFRYRVYIHPGDAHASGVRERYVEYVAPPEVVAM